MDHTKIDPADLDSPCRGLSVRGLGFVVAFFCSFRNWFFVCVYWGPIQLYGRAQSSLHVSLMPIYVATNSRGNNKSRSSSLREFSDNKTFGSVDGLAPLQ